MIEVLGLLTTATVFGGIVLYSFGFAQLVFCALFGGRRVGSIDWRLIITFSSSPQPRLAAFCRSH